jgi:hypothetical protein
MNSLREWIELWLSRIPNNLEIRPLQQVTYRPVKALFSRHPEEIETYLNEHDDCHLFFGVSGRQGQRGEKENVKEIHCLWVDIDFKDLPDGQVEADGILATFDLKPTLIIASGGGYHAYWFLNEPVKNIELAERVLKGLAIRLKGDVKSAEAARILRVPFSVNWKYEPPKDVAINVYNEENIYDFSEFEEWELKPLHVQTEQQRDDWFKEGKRDHDLHYVGCRLIEGGATTDATEEVLTRLVNSWGENDPKWVQTKVKAAVKTIHKEKGNLEQRIKDYIDKTTGQFSIGALVQWLGLQGEDKFQCGNIIISLHQANEIVSVGNKHGVFRRVDKNPDLMDLETPPQDDIGISLPLALHMLVVLYPRNVVLVAGEKDSGKTAFAMNAAYLNRDRLDVTYFNSEMGVTELQSRIRKFPQDHFPYNEWKKIRWIERATRFEDYVDPDGLNIIDFLEVGAEAFTVTEDIKRVFDKLDKGLLLIVMQKRSYKEYAVGGEGTLEKARLAINLEHRDGATVCKITVAKNWTGIINSPRGCECQYKIWQGGKMEKDGEWHRPEDVEQKPKERGFKGGR